MTKREEIASLRSQMTERCCNDEEKIRDCFTDVRNDGTKGHCEEHRDEAI